jgi:hypothetical protein
VRAGFGRAAYGPGVHVSVEPVDGP